MVAFEITFCGSENLTERIKGARSTMLRGGAPTDYMFVHRFIPIEHGGAQTCWCDPVIIANGDWRDSAYFAEQILSPTIH